MSFVDHFKHNEHNGNLGEGCFIIFYIRSKNKFNFKQQRSFRLSSCLKVMQ